MKKWFSEKIKICFVIHNSKEFPIALHYYIVVVSMSDHEVAGSIPGTSTHFKNVD